VLPDSRSLIISGIVVSMCLGSFGLGYWVGRQRSSSDPVVQLGKHVRGANPGGMRERIREAIEEASASSHNPQELHAYLDSLEARARKQGNVSALEVEPGIAQIRRVLNREDEVRIFGERMRHLQSTLNRPTADGESWLGGTRD
jgi:hypothetical protein